jgi:hypothetical protein
MTAAPRLAGAGSFGPYWIKRSAAWREERPEAAVEAAWDCSRMFVGTELISDLLGFAFRLPRSLGRP